MHEYALTNRIVEIALETAQKQKADKVCAITLVIGECSGVLIDSVQLYFDMIAEGTAAEGARLQVHVIRPQMRCPVCNQNFTRPRFSFACPQCGALGSPTDIGKEFYIESVELEQ